jgi:hypothetical protein
MAHPGSSLSPAPPTFPFGAFWREKLVREISGLLLTTAKFASLQTAGARRSWATSTEVGESESEMCGLRTATQKEKEKSYFHSLVYDQKSYEHLFLLNYLK